MWGKKLVLALLEVTCLVFTIAGWKWRIYGHALPEGEAVVIAATSIATVLLESLVGQNE